MWCDVCVPLMWLIWSQVGSWLSNQCWGWVIGHMFSTWFLKSHLWKNIWGTFSLCTYNINEDWIPSDFRKANIFNLCIILKCLTKQYKEFLCVNYSLVWILWFVFLCSCTLPITGFILLWYLQIIIFLRNMF